MALAMFEVWLALTILAFFNLTPRSKCLKHSIYFHMAQDQGRKQQNKDTQRSSGSPLQKRMQPSLGSKLGAASLGDLPH